MKKFLDLILGTTDVPTYFAGFFFALIGMSFVYYLKIKKRNKSSNATPYSFSLKFFIQDNLVDLLFSIIGIFVSMRFSVEYAGVEVTMIYSLGLGILSSGIVDRIVAFSSKARD